MKPGRVTYINPVDGSEQISLGSHELQVGGIGDGYCYGHQSFDCVDNLTTEEHDAIANAETDVGKQ